MSKEKVQRTPRNNVDQLFKQSIELVEKHHLIYVEDIIDLLPISKPTFYDYFPLNSDSFNAIKEALNREKVQLKVGLRKKMYNSQNPSNLIALYKLCATEEEKRALATNYQDHSGEIEVNTKIVKVGYGRKDD